ncbi:MAG: hypothetical protein CAPSK01_002228 [Candidatus Accumulibacter vicinus]|uniref:Uncharacterized protein n=1 Tax=Candidatus Accumulibacter vicinus TaxID=2954382 RepID=A0A084Y0Y0_9PROT|nr:MAG: hypothetical protein CAPSK01_002228 [Candidatus Accumulibacter vicinus]
MTPGEEFLEFPDLYSTEAAIQKAGIHYGLRVRHLGLPFKKYRRCKRNARIADALCLRGYQAIGIALASATK